jgi:hypothetical protein
MTSAHRGFAGVAPGRLCYTVPMTKEQVKEIADCVPTWPAERHADVAES